MLDNQPTGGVNMKYPVITLWQPWASLVAMGKKKIETRTHKRFYCLRGKTILIHAANKIDVTGCLYEDIGFVISYIKSREVLGKIICMADVVDVRMCNRLLDESEALIECVTPRYGLWLDNIKPIDPIPAKGKQGIWYYDLITNQQVKP